MGVAGFAPVVSPVLEGYISSHIGWRMLFWVMAGAGLVLIIARQRFIGGETMLKRSLAILLSYCIALAVGSQTQKA